MHKAEDGGKAFCDEIVKSIERRPVKVLDCLFAREEEAWGTRFADDANFFSKNISEVEMELATSEKFLEQIKHSDVIFFQGGIPKVFMAVLQTVGDWQKWLEGKVIVASSGSADTFCKYYGVGKTGNIGEGLGILPVKIIPHWQSDYEVNINWDELLQKLKSYKEDLTVFTIKEGEFIVVEK